jgi:hypothetical protein
MRIHLISEIYSALIKLESHLISRSNKTGTKVENVANFFTFIYILFDLNQLAIF